MTDNQLHSRPIKVMFVCMGNICRSPTAHGVFQQLVDKAGLTDDFIIESSGTTAYHVGEPPDRRASITAAGRGVNLSHLSAQKVIQQDYINQNYILAMDYENLRNMKNECPQQYQSKIQLLLNYHPVEHLMEVPDPYYGGDSGFEDVYEMIEVACKNLLNNIKKSYS